MEAWRQRAKDLLAQGEVKIVVGYGKGTGEARRPRFIREPGQAERLELDASCRQNLAVYATKPEVRQSGKVAMVALPATQRALLQLLAERQLQDGDVIALAVDGDRLAELRTAAALEEHLADRIEGPAPEDKALLDRLEALSREERWAFWQKALSRCMKCYACRNSCPMCYCGRCTMECNRPQWIPVASHNLGNLEYHLVRTMHLAGRCVECGECGRACPVGIPVHLLTCSAEATVHEHFGQRAGHLAKLDYAPSTFKADDKESFIR